MSIPIGTYLSKVQHCSHQGKLPLSPYENPSQPFHFAVMKNKVEKETDDFMIFSVSTYPDLRSVCGSLHAMFLQFRLIFGEDPAVLESKGFRAAVFYCKQWDSIMILMTTYRFSTRFLQNCLNRLVNSLPILFPKPSYKAAVFSNNSLIWFSKSMDAIEGFPSVLANLKDNTKKPPETDTLLTDVGAPQLISNAVEDRVIMSSCSVFVYGRLLFTTMNDIDLSISVLIVANQQQTTEEYPTNDGRAFCVARHYDTCMVSVSSAGDGLKRCCEMQASMMRLDSKGVISKMQASFYKVLPPETALDVAVVSGQFVVSQPPHIGAPLFQSKNETMEAKSIASLMYPPLTSNVLRAVIDYIVNTTEFKLRYSKNGDAMTFWLSPIKTLIDEKELDALPHLLKGVRGTL